MLSRLLQRLRHQESGLVAVENDDRRTWFRYPSQCETTCRVINSVADPIPAKVRNVSRGGINLVVQQEIKPGTLIRVDLPHTGGPVRTSLLACVLHSAVIEEGEWSIGASFSAEIGDYELSAFGGRKQATELSDQRAWVRFPAHGTAEYQRLNSENPSLGFAEVLNISPTGVGLEVTELVEPGTVLNLELMTKSRDHTFTMLACVVYTGEKDEGHWVIGCNFIQELSDSQLKQLR